MSTSIFPLDTTLRESWNTTDAVTPEGLNGPGSGFNTICTNINNVSAAANELNTDLNTNHVGQGGGELNGTGGSAAVHGVATDSVDGFMSAPDKTHFDEHIISSDNGYSGHNNATPNTGTPPSGGVAGFMSAADKTNLDSLKAGAHLVSTNGYQYLPVGADGNKLIMQWGTTGAQTSNDQGVPVLFPIGFPSYCFNITASCFYPTVNADNDNTANIVAMTQSGFVLNFSHTSGDGNDVEASGAYWFAIGC